MNMRTTTITPAQAYRQQEREIREIHRNAPYARAAKARAAYKRRQVRNNVLLAPLKVLLIALNIVLVPVMIVVGFVMVLLAPVFILAAILKPFVLAAGVIVSIIGIVQIINGGNWVTLIVGAILLWLSTAKVTVK